MPNQHTYIGKKRLNKPNKDIEIEKKILNIRKNNPNYGYRRITATLKRSGLIINKKKVQRLVQKLKLQVKSYSRKSRKYLSYKGQVGKISGNKINRNFKVEKPYTKLFTDPNIFLDIAFFNSNATITYFAFAIVYFLIKYFTRKKRISK